MSKHRRRYTFYLEADLAEEWAEWFEKLEGHTMNKKFNNWVRAQIHKPSKEEWKKKIQEEREPQYERILQIAESCVYHAINKNEDWYCERKKIPKEVCIAQLRRFMAMGKRCHPPKTYKKRIQQQPSRYDGKIKYGVGPIYQGDAGEI